MLDSVGESGVDAYIELNRVLASWRKALRLENRSVDRQAVIGLFAELTVLLRMAEQDPDAALHAWRGPEGHRHDFSRTNALEVKGYTNEASTVTIHGLRQLDPPPSGDLHLLAMRLEESTAGRTLADLIEELDGRGISVDMLEQRCDSQEPLFSDSEIRLHILSGRVFHVGSDFPGLRESRLSPQALKGVDRVAYTLHLDACPNELNEGDVRRVIHEL